MKINVIRVGNSRGIRLPKPVLEQCGIGDQVELSVKGNTVMLSPVNDPRDGWEDAFAKAKALPPEEPLLDDLPTEWDATEWRW